MVPGAKLYTVGLHDEVSDCFNWVGTRLFVNLDKKADLGVSENGDRACDRESVLIERY